MGIDELLRLIMQSNPGWNYAYCLGYIHGKEDAIIDTNTQDVSRLETTDFAHGYWRGKHEDTVTRSNYNN